MTLVSQTEQILRKALEEGRFPGNRLPTSIELADQLGVSRETVRLVPLPVALDTVFWEHSIISWW